MGPKGEKGYPGQTGRRGLPGFQVRKWPCHTYKPYFNHYILLPREHVADLAIQESTVFQDIPGNKELLDTQELMAATEVLETWARKEIQAFQDRQVLMYEPLENFEDFPCVVKNIFILNREGMDQRERKGNLHSLMMNSLRKVNPEKPALLVQRVGLEHLGYKAPWDQLVMMVRQAHL